MSFLKKDAFAIVFRCADQYKSELLNNSLLLICRKKTENIYALELTFDASNFQHLTGCERGRVEVKRYQTSDFRLQTPDSGLLMSDV